jgi:hypothetical protein
LVPDRHFGGFQRVGAQVEMGWVPAPNFEWATVLQTHVIRHENTTKKTTVFGVPGSSQSSETLVWGDIAWGVVARVGGPHVRLELEGGPVYSFSAPEFVSPLSFSANCSLVTQF